MISLDNELLLNQDETFYKNPTISGENNQIVTDF